MQTEIVFLHNRNVIMTGREQTSSSLSDNNILPRIKEKERNCVHGTCGMRPVPIPLPAPPRTLHFILIPPSPPSSSFCLFFIIIIRVLLLLLRTLYSSSRAPGARPLQCQNRHKSNSVHCPQFFFSFHALFLFLFVFLSLCSKQVSRPLSFFSYSTLTLELSKNQSVDLTVRVFLD